MPAKLERCVSSVKKQLRKDHPDWSDKKINSVAYATCVKSTGLSPHENEETLMLDKDSQIMITEAIKGSYIENIKFKYFMECEFGEDEIINEKAMLDELRKVKGLNLEEEIPVFGRAINETTTKNFHVYTGDELEPAAPTLKNAHIITDHRLDTEHTVGKVKEAWYDNSVRTIRYIGGVDKQDPVVRKIKLKYITGVSVGGHVKEMICSICDQKMTWTHEHFLGEKYEGKVAKGLMKGIVFEELTLTPRPADNRSTLMIANSIEESVQDTFMSVYNAVIKKRSEHQKVLDNQSYGTPSESHDCGCEHITETEDNPERFIEMSSEISKEELKKAYIKEQELLKQIDELKEQIGESEALKKQLAEINAREHDRLIDEVLDLEIKVGKTAEAERKVRKIDLLDYSDAQLNARREALQEWAKSHHPSEPAIITSNSKSIVTQEPSSSGNPLAGINNEQLIREAKTRRLQELIFREASVSKNGQNDYHDFDNDLGRWKIRI